MVLFHMKSANCSGKDASATGTRGPNQNLIVAAQEAAYIAPLELTKRFAISVSDDGSKFTFALNVSKFGPDELKVNINGRTLTVEGKQEVKEDSSYTSFRSFLRQWTLPEGVGAEQIGSSLTDEVSWPSSYQSSKRPSALGVTTPLTSIPNRR
ncbi:Hsp20/alpha crystallin family protein, partial [Cooperia oncophora]